MIYKGTRAGERVVVRRTGENAVIAGRRGVLVDDVIPGVRTGVKLDDGRSFLVWNDELELDREAG